MEIGEATKSRFKNPQTKVIVNVRYTANFIGQHFNNFMSQFDLSMPQFNILRILRGAGKPLCVNEVKSRMIERSPNTTRLMDKLIEKGLMERVRCDEDRRLVYVSITEQGMQLLGKIDLGMDEATVFSQNLDDAEAEELSRLLDKLRGSCPLTAIAT
jgi:DNA-binding MarR family transcriptional regulator